MLVPRRLRLALEIGLAALAVALAAYGVSLGLAAATSGTLPPEALASAPRPEGRSLGPLESYSVIAARDVSTPPPPPTTGARRRVCGCGASAFTASSRAP